LSQVNTNVVFLRDCSFETEIYELYYLICIFDFSVSFGKVHDSYAIYVTRRMSHMYWNRLFPSWCFLWLLAPDLVEVFIRKHYVILGSLPITEKHSRQTMMCNADNMHIIIESFYFSILHIKRYYSSKELGKNLLFLAFNWFSFKYF